MGCLARGAKGLQERAILPMRQFLLEFRVKPETFPVPHFFQADCQSRLINAFSLAGRDAKPGFRD